MVPGDPEQWDPGGEGGHQRLGGRGEAGELVGDGAPVREDGKVHDGWRAQPHKDVSVHHATELCTRQRLGW